MPVHINRNFTEFNPGTVFPSLVHSRIRKLHDKTLGYLKMVTFYHRRSRAIIGIELPFLVHALGRIHWLYNSLQISNQLCFWKTVEETLKLKLFTRAHIIPKIMC